MTDIERAEYELRCAAERWENAPSTTQAYRRQQYNLLRDQLRRVKAAAKARSEALAKGTAPKCIACGHVLHRSEDGTFACISMLHGED